CEVRIENSGVIASGKLALKIGATEYATNTNAVTVNPNEPKKILLCKSSGGCFGSEVTADTLGAGVTSNNDYYIVGYDYWDNLRGVVTTGQWSVTATSPGGMTDPADYVLTASNGQADLLAKSANGSPTTITLKGHEPSLGAGADKTVVVTVTPGVLDSIEITDYTDVSGGIVAGDGNFEIREIRAYYDVGGVKFLKTDYSSTEAISLGGTVEVNGNTTGCAIQ